MLNWDDIEATPTYQELEPDRQTFLKQEWFKENIEPSEAWAKTPEPDKETVRTNFFGVPRETSGALESVGKVIKGAVKGAARGLTTELPGMAGGALEYAATGETPSITNMYLTAMDTVFPQLGISKMREKRTEFGKPIAEVGKSIKEWSEEKGKEWYGPEPTKGVEWAVHEGAKMLAPSVVPGMVGATGIRILSGIGKVVGAAKAAKIAGDVAGYEKLMAQANSMASKANDLASAGVAGLFGASQAQQTMDSAEEEAQALEKMGQFEQANRVRRAAKVAAPIAGSIEAGGEYLGTKYLGKLFGLDEAEVLKIGPKNLIKRFIWNLFGVKGAKTLGVEVGTEVGQQFGEAGVEKYAGVRPEAKPLMEALDVIAPTTAMVFMTGGLAAGASKLRRTPREERQAKPTSEKQAYLDHISDQWTKGEINQADLAEAKSKGWLTDQEITQIQEAPIELTKRAEEEPIDLTERVEEEPIDLGKPWTRSMGETEEVRGPKYVPVSRRPPEARNLPSEEVEGEETPYMGPSEFEKLRGILYGKKGRLKEQVEEPIEEKPVSAQQLEDMEFQEWARKAANRQVSKEEYDTAKRMIDRLQEDDEFRRWEMKARNQTYAEGTEAPAALTAFDDLRNILKGKQGRFVEKPGEAAGPAPTPIVTPLKPETTQVVELPQEKVEPGPAGEVRKALPSPETAKEHFARLKKEDAEQGKVAQRIADKSGGKPLVMTIPGQERGVIIHKSTKKGGGFQVTWWDKKGFTGDFTEKTMKDAIRQAQREGYTQQVPLETFDKIARSRKFQKWSEFYEYYRNQWEKPAKGEGVIELPAGEVEGKGRFKEGPGAVQKITTTHLIQNPAKTWSYVGSVPQALAKNTDGETRVWPTKEEAIKAASDLGVTVYYKNEAVEPRTKSLPGNLLLRMKDGTVHESTREEAPVHGVMVTNLNLNPGDIDATGLRDKNGEVVWSKPGKEVKPFTTEEARAVAQQRKQETQAKIRKMASNAPTFRMWINNIGGINQNDPTLKGELRDIRWTTNAKGKKVIAKGFPPGFFSGKARSSDDITLQAIEAGWLPEGSDENDLMKAIISNPSVTEKWTNAGNDIDKMVDEEYEKIYGEELGENWRDEKFRQDREEISRRAKAILQGETPEEVAAEESVTDEQKPSLETLHNADDFDWDTGKFKETTEEKPPYKISKSTAKTLLSLPFERQTYPYGDENSALRVAIIEELTGQKVPKSKAGATAVRDALLKDANITKVGKAIVQYENELRTWLGSIAEQQSLFGPKQKPAFELKPTEPTPEEKIAIARQKGEAAPKGEAKRVVIPTEKIKAPTTGKQTSLLPPKKGETRDLFEQGVDKIGESDLQYIYEPATGKEQISIFDFKPAEQAKVGNVPEPSQRVRVSTTGNIKAAGNVISGSGDAAALLSFLRRSPQEYLYSVTVDKDGVVLEVHKYVKGGKSGASVYGTEVAGRILNVKDATKAYVIHNHPSGATAWSPEDAVLSHAIKKLLESGDIDSESLIIGKTKYLKVPSVEGEQPIPPKIRKTLIPVKERSRLIRTKDAPVITDPEQAKQVHANHFNGDDGVMLLDRKNHAIAFVPFIKGRSMKQTTRDIVKTAEATNASAYVAFNNKDLSTARNDYLDSLSYGIADLGVIDIIWAGKSRADTQGMPKGVVSKYDRLISETRLKAEPAGGPALPFESINSHIDRIIRKWKGAPTVNVVEDYGHLPASVKKAFREKFQDTDAQGMRGIFVAYSDETKPSVYLIADKMASLDEAERTLLHEVIGHYGVRQAFGKSPALDRFLGQIYFTKAKQIKEMVEKFPAYKGYDLKTPEGRMKAADELFAREVAEKGIDQDPWLKRQWDRLVEIVNNALRTMGFKVTLNDAEIRQVLRAAVRAVKEGPSKGIQVDSVSAMISGERAPADTNSPEFKAWFKGSKVVDENGKPLVVYHATSQEFSEFKRGDIGFHFGTKEQSEPRIKTYMANPPHEETVLRGGSIIPAYLSLKNPLRMRDVTNWDFPTFINDELRIRGAISQAEYDTLEKDRSSTSERLQKIRELLQSKGYDGIIYLNRHEGAEVSALAKRTYDSDESFLATHPNAKDSYIAFSPTQIKSIFNRGMWSPEVADISASIMSPEEFRKHQLPAETKAQEEFDEEHQDDTLKTFDTLRGLLKAGKRGWKPQKEDTHWLDRIYSVPLHHFQKVPALGRLFTDATNRTDNYYSLVNSLTQGPDQKYHTATIETFRKQEKGEFKKFQNYLVSRDRNQIGFKVKKTKKDKYELFLGDTKYGGTFATEEQAWNQAIALEVAKYRNQGASNQAADALNAFRQVTHNGFRILMKNMRDIIDRFETLGLPLPQVAIKVEGGKSVNVDLKMALAKMGDMRGYYFPRIRKPGQYMLTAKKKGTNPILEFFDTKMMLTKRQMDLEHQGYSVTKDLSPKLPEDVFQMAGEVIAMQATINSALERIHSKGITLDDFGLKWTDRIVKPSHRDFMVSGPTTKAMTPIFKNLGGKFYSAYEGEVRAWHFHNPGAYFEKRLAKALANEVGIIDQETDLLFAKTLAEQVADVIKARGHRAHMIERADAKGTDVWTGYEEDPAVAVAQYARGIAAGEAKKDMALDMVRHFTGTDISWRDYKADKEDAGQEPDYEEYMKLVEERRINPTKQPNAFKEGKVFMEDMLRNQEHIDRVMGTIKGIAVLKYLAGRVSAPLVNLTALATSAPGAISGYANVSIPKAFASIGKAGTLYTQYLMNRKFGKGLIADQYKDLFDEIESKGWHKAQYNREALSILESRLGRHWNNLIEYSMAMFGASEQLNRVSTIAGAYLALKDSTPSGKFVHEKALEKAKEISDKAHAVYGKANRPHWMRGGGLGAQLATSFYVFKTFSHNYLLTMKDLGFNQGEAKAALFMAVAPMILAGTGALVGKQLISGIAQALGIGGDDPEETFYQWVYDNAGEKAENIARHGIFGGLGINLKGSLEIGITDIPTTISEALGAPASIFQDLYQGGKSILRGDVMKGAERMLPSAMGAPIRAYREATEGVTTGTNAPVFYGTNKLVADTVESIYRALSFNPSRISGIREKQRKEAEIEQKYSKLREDVYAKFKRFFLTPSSERSKADFIDLITEVKKYNERVIASNLHRKGIPLITDDVLKQNMQRAFIPTKKERMREAQ